MARAVVRGLGDRWNSPSFGPQRADQDRARRQSRTLPQHRFLSTPTTALSFAPAAYDFILLHLFYHDAYWESARFELPRIDPNTVPAASFGR